MNRYWLPLWGRAALVALAYLGVALLVFAFRHPEMTSTQVLLHLWDALRFRSVGG